MRYAIGNAVAGPQQIAHGCQCSKTDGWVQVFFGTANGWWYETGVLSHKGSLPGLCNALL